MEFVCAVSQPSSGREAEVHHGLLVSQTLVDAEKAIGKGYEEMMGRRCLTCELQCSGLPSALTRCCKRRPFVRCLFVCFLIPRR